MREARGKKKRTELTLWQRARLRTTSRMRADMSRRPRVANWTPVDKEPFLGRVVPNRGRTMRKERSAGVPDRLTVYTESGVELVDDFVHRIGAKRHCTHMKLLHFHLCRNIVKGRKEGQLGKKITILGQCTGLITEEILDSAEFFG